MKERCYMSVLGVYWGREVDGEADPSNDISKMQQMGRAGAQQY
jgi:hypothetical protein